MKFSFDAFIGDDIKVCVTGDYDKPDRSVGYWGSFDVEEVTTFDSNVNIISLLDDKAIQRLEDKAMDAYRDAQDDAKQEAAEARYQANLEYQRFLKGE